MKIPVVAIDTDGGRDEIVVDEAAIRAYYARLGIEGDVAEFLRTVADAFERDPGLGADLCAECGAEMIPMVVRGLRRWCCLMCERVSER